MFKKTKKNDFVSGSFLSTGKIARYCETTVVQVNRWINNGDLKAFRTPGRQFRVTKDTFREFLERHEMPISEEFFGKKNKKKVLVADDDEDLVSSICKVLRIYNKDLEIEISHDGYEALMKAGDFKPDLLILDIRMPKIDGLEVCRRIYKNRTITPQTKILAITGHSESYDRDTVLKSGADEYLLKPFDMETLLEYVDRLI